MTVGSLDDYKGYVGANVRGLRRRLGLTQEQLAEAVPGLAVRSLQSVESGRANVSLSVLVGLAHALSVEPDELLRRTVFEPPPAGRPRRTGTARPAR